MKRVLRPSILFLQYFAFCAGMLLFMRLVYFLAFRDLAKNAITSQLWKAAYLGSKFDLRLAAFMVLPLGIALCIPKVDFFKARWLQSLTAVLMTLIITSVLIVYAADFGFVSYLETRVSAAAFKFLENPIISLKMVWQTYPVVWILLGLFGLMAMHYWGFTKLVARTAKREQTANFKIKAANFFLCFLIWAGFVYGKFAHYPLRWSEAFFSTQSFVSNFALNPVLYLYETATFSKKDFDVKKTQEYYPVIAKYLNVDHPDLKTLSFLRDHKATNPPKKQPNVIIILLESLAADKTSIAGNKLDPTPYLAKIAKDSMLFTHCFTPTEASARGLFATVTGIPDVSLVQSSTRNPFVVNQNTVMNQFKDYEKFFFLNGSANWGNVRGIMSHNIEGIHIYEEGSFKGKHTNVWGISDLQLYREADQVFRKQDKPFIAIFDTSSFHRPFTIPEDSDGFEKVEYDNDKLEANSFYSNDQLNALRFQDHAMQRFFEIAKDADYYDNTIWVLLGDHGLPATSAPNAPAGYLYYKLIAHHTPLLFYAPSMIKPSVSGKIVSQIDVIPSIAAMTGQSFKNTTLGRNIFTEINDENSYAFVYTWQEIPPKIGLVGPEFYYVDSPQLKGMYKHSDKDYKTDMTKKYPEEFKKMSDIAQGIYFTSQYMLYNNPKL